MTVHSLTRLLVAAERARTAYEWEQAISCYGEALAQGDVTTEQAYELHDGRAFCFRRLGEAESELQELEAMAELAVLAGNEEWHLDTLIRQAAASNALRDLAQCRAHVAAARRTAREAQSPLFAARAQFVMGSSYVTEGNFDRGAQECAAAMKVFRTLGALQDEAKCAYLIGYCASYTGQNGVPYAERILEIARQLDDRLLLGRAYQALGTAHRDVPSVGLRFDEKALEIFKEIRERSRIGATMHNSAVRYFELGVYKRSYLLFLEALQHVRHVDSFGSSTLTRHMGAVAAFGAGHQDEALDMNQQANSEAIKLKEPVLQAFTMLARAVMLTPMARAAEAQSLFERAMETAGPSGYRAVTLAWLADACLAQGNVEAAVQHTEEALTWLDEVTDSTYPETVLCVAYHVLQAASGQQDRARAKRILERGMQTVLSHSQSISDRGLRRFYLAHNRLLRVPDLVLAWAQEAHARGEAFDALHERWSGGGNMEQRFKNLLAFSARLAAEREPQEMPAFILDEFMELSGAERAFLALRPEGDEGRPQIVAASGIAAFSQEAVYERAGSLIEKALLARHAILHQHIDNAPDGEPPIVHQRSLLIVPLVSPSRVMGVLYGDIREIFGPFTREDADLLTMLANHAAVALENAAWTETLEERVAQRTQELDSANRQLAQQNAELAVINSVQRGLVARVDMDAIYELVGEQIREIFDAKTVSIGTFEGQPLQQIVHYLVEDGERYPKQSLPLGRLGQLMIAERRSFLMETQQDFIDLGLRTYEGTQPVLSGLFVPILHENEVWGGITIQNVRHERAFTREDVRLLETLAHATSLALQNARLFDETQRRALENARLYSEAQEARAAAEAANESKSAFLANVSHELRTPLTSILGFTRIVQKRLDERIFPQLTDEDAKVKRAGEQVRKNLEIVLNEGERLTTLINNVLDLEKIESGRVEWRMEPVSLSDVMEQALQATSSIVEQAGLSLVKELPEDLPAVTGDRDKLVQVMINLISNAVKFTREGRITCCVRADDDEVRVAVSDTGVGIAPEDLDAVFEKFRQVGDTLTGKPAGTGLGLPICKEIVERHGGRIWVESAPGEGSTFQFAIPTKEADDL